MEGIPRLCSSMVHPPAKPSFEILEARGPMIGAVPDLEFETASTTLGQFAKLCLYSDGVYEIERIDKTMWPFNDFIEFMKEGPSRRRERLQDGSTDRLRPGDPGPRRIYRRLLDRRAEIHVIERF